MTTKTYNNVDDLPDLNQDKKPKPKSVDDLPDLTQPVKKKEPFSFPPIESYYGGGRAGSFVGPLEDGKTIFDFAKDQIKKHIGDTKPKPNQKEILAYMNSLKEPQPQQKIVTDQVLPAKKKKAPTQEEIDNEAVDRLADIMYGDNDKWKDPIKSSLESKDKNPFSPTEVGVRNRLHDVISNDLLSDGYNAKKALTLTDVWREADDNNLTARSLRKAADEYDKVTTPLKGINLVDDFDQFKRTQFEKNVGLLQSEQGKENLSRQLDETIDEDIEFKYREQVEKAAILAYANKHPEFKKELGTVGIDPTGDFSINSIPEGKRGLILQEFYSDPNVIAYATKENPQFAPVLQSLQRNLIFKNPTYGKNLMANQISRAVEESGWDANDPIFRFERKSTKNFADGIAKDLFKGDPKTMEFYEKHKEEILDNLDMPSLFEGVASGGKSFFQGIANTFRQPFTSDKQTQTEAWKKEASNVSANPDGVIKFLRDSGHTIGLVGGIAATGNVLGATGLGAQGGNAAAVGVGFFGDQLESAKLKYPNNPVKAWTTAAFNTSLYMALSYDLTKQASKAAFGKVKPELDKVVQNLTNGSITRTVAKRQANNILRKAYDFVGGAAKTNARISAELTGIEMLNHGLDKVMGLDQESFDKFHPESLGETFKHTFLSNAMLSGLMQFGQMRRGNKIVESNLYEAASNPKKYERLIEEAKVKDPTLNAEEMIGNLRFLTETKLKLEEQGISESNQARFLFEEMKGRVLSQNLKSSPESSITRQGKEELKTSEEIREAILRGEDAETFKTESEKKEDQKRQEANTEIESLTKNKELDNKEIDAKIEGLDKESTTYSVQKERLELQRKENNDYYDNRIKKIQEEFPEPEDPRRGPEMDSLMEELKKKAADTEQFADLQYFIDKATEDPGEFKKRFGKDATEKLLEYVSTEKLEQSYQKAVEADLMNAADSIAKELDRRAEQVKKDVAPSVIMPGEIPNRETVTIAPQEIVSEPKSKGPAIILPKPNETKTEQTNVERVEPESTVQEESVIEEPPIQAEGTTETPPSGRPGEQVATDPSISVSGNEMIGISHERMNKTARELGMADYEQFPETVKEWDIQVDERLRKDPDAINKMLNRLREGKVDDPVDQRMMLKYIASLKDKINKNPTDELLNEFKRARSISDIAGRTLGKGLVARKGELPVEETLADYLINEIDLNKQAPLTERQKETVQKEFKDISEANEALKQKVAAMEAERAKQDAEKSLPKKKGEKRDWQKEKGDILSSIQEKLKKARGDTSITLVPYAKELIAIAPDVAKLVKVLVEQGVEKLGDVVKEVKGVLSASIPQITDKDVHDLIAGNYNEKKQTRNQLAEKLRDLKLEAKLTSKLQELNDGVEPKNEKQKIQRNQKIEELKSKIKEHDLTKLADYKRRTEKEIKRVEEQIRTGNFDPAPKPEPIKMDAEAKALRDKLIELRQKRELRILQRQYENSSKWDKFVRNAANVLNVPRTLMASVDYSAPLRQALLPTIGHPLMAAKAAGNMFKASFSKKFYDRWFDDLQNSPGYELMKESKLGLTDTKDPKLTAREEEYMSNLAQKIPFIGKAIKLGSGVPIPFTGKKIKEVGGLISGSERAYSMYLNKMRVDLFNMFVGRMQKDGKTWENSKDEYKAVAAFVNNMTGRGDLGETLNKATPILSGLFFSPRLMASRLNTLTYLTKPSFYKRLPSEVRKDYFRNMLGTAAVGLTILGMAKMAGAETEDDPRSPDFGKIKSGNTRWDIWGGHQQYIKTAAQILTGQKKSSTSGDITEMGKNPLSGSRLSTLMGFFRGKLAPVPSVVTDLLEGENAVGEKLTTDWVGGKKEIGLGRYLAQHLLPLTATGLSEAIRDQGGKAIFTVGVPAAFGVGTQTYKAKDQDYNEEDKKDPVFKYFLDKGVELPEAKTSNIQIEDKDGKTLKKLEEYGEEAVIKYKETRKRYLKEELQSVKDGDIVVYVDSYGRISTTNDDPKKEKEEISLSKMTKEQLKELMGILGGNATKKTKVELYGDE